MKNNDMRAKNKANFPLRVVPRASSALQNPHDHHYDSFNFQSKRGSHGDFAVPMTQKFNPSNYLRSSNDFVKHEPSGLLSRNPILNVPSRTTISTYSKHYQPIEETICHKPVLSRPIDF